MNLSDEITRLQDLHRSGALSDEEFARAKARVIGSAGPAADAPPGMAAINTFRLSRDDRWLGGVCGGIARATGVESWIWRLLFTTLAVFGGVGVLAYVLLWIFVPNE